MPDELPVDVVGADGIVEFVEPEVEDVLLLTEHAGFDEACGFPHQSLLVDRVRGEQHTRGAGLDHLLYDHGHRHLVVIDAVTRSIHHSPLGEQRRPAAVDMLEDCVDAHQVEVGVVQTGERHRRQVLHRGARPHRERHILTPVNDGTADRFFKVLGNGGALDGSPNPRRHLAELVAVSRHELSKLIEIAVMAHPTASPMRKTRTLVSSRLATDPASGRRCRRVRCRREGR